MTPDSSEPINPSPPSGVVIHPPKPKDSFNYDKDLIEQYQIYLRDKNHHGLALLARQKGVPPFMRFKVWSILIKHHPFVVNPFIQPDKMDMDKSSSDSDSEDSEKNLKHKIRKDLRRYLHRIAFTTSEEPLSQTESQIFDILENSILKFVTKWGRVIKYDQALTWIALGLAEWLPPIPHTPWVLLGRDISSSDHTCYGSIFDDYEEFIDSVPDLREFLDEMVEDELVSHLKFHEVYERLILVLLHSPEQANKRTSSKISLKIDKSTLPTSGGTIEERVSFFIYIFQKMLPELSQYFSEEQILNKFGSHDDEWVLWWLKYCGSKVWSKVDRGRVWDLLLGWRSRSKKSDEDKSYYHKRLNISDAVLEKLGPDAFWSVDYEEDDSPVEITRGDSFSNLINDLHIDNTTSKSSSSPSSPSSSLSEPSPESLSLIPFCKVDPHIELLFVSLALLKAKENTLVELDQFEIRVFLSRLPAKTYKSSEKYKQYQEQKDKEKGSTPVDHGFTYDYMDSIISEAGDIWRKWLWLELNGDS